MQYYFSTIWGIYSYKAWIHSLSTKIYDLFFVSQTYSRDKHDKDHVGLMNREVDNQKDPNDDISGDISEDDFSQNQLNSIAPIPVEQLGKHAFIFIIF